MAEDSSRASSPEPGEAAPPRGRIVQLKSSSSASRGSMERQSLESARAGASPAYSQQSQQWRGSPPRSRFPRPAYSSAGGGGRDYFKRQQPPQQMSYDAAERGGAPSYPSERVFSRARGRSVSRSPSRASQRTRSRSRSHSPRSPKSPLRSRSRSRSRSFSPRGHRTFANWERSGRNPPAGGQQFVSGRGGRGGGFDSRQRGRERHSWPRGGGRGGGRYANYQRGNRFYPKEVRYKSAAPMPHRRSISRDRGSSEGGAQASASFRDRQMRERDQREYEQAYRGRPRERDAGNRSTSLARASSFSSDYYRDSEPSASAEEGEEKPEESHVTTSERSVGSRSPSDTGSTDRDMTSAADNSLKRMASVPARPPRPSTDSYSSYRREASSPIANDGYRSPVDRRERYPSETASRISTSEGYDADARSRSRIDSREVDRRETKGRAYGSPSVDGDDAVKRKSRDDSMDKTANIAVDTGDLHGRSSPGADIVSSVRAWGGSAIFKQTAEATKTDEPVDNTTSKANEPICIADDASGTSARAVIAPSDSSEVLAEQKEAVEKRSGVVEDKEQSPKESQPSSNQGPSDYPEAKISVENRTTLPVAPDSNVPEVEEVKSAGTSESIERGLMNDVKTDKRTISTLDDVDMGAASDVDQRVSGQLEVSVSDVEMKSVDEEEKQNAGKTLSSEAPVFTRREEVQEKKHAEEHAATVPTGMHQKPIYPESKEVEEGR
ncbi:hypothetical protein PF005_g10834 [Phytophthora fragariae]|uniref:Uncharacterized protein n=1 Tax=Phytophthora fragariae TaxID=53985 RepID=A0A6A3Y482_9STRA|nr:hypothetical protein PF005_g10834 [Phytophthora fragariae]